MAPVLRPVEDRFWEKVDRRGFDECWLWLPKARHRFGYGTFHLNPGELEAEKTRYVGAHQVAFRLIHGYWPAPCALHGCDNPPCCNALNPAHIHEGSKADNARERDARGRGGSTAGYLLPSITGERHPQAKLTQAQAEEIRARYRAGGVTQKTLGVEFGLSDVAVGRIVRGIGYKSLQGD